MKSPIHNLPMVEFVAAIEDRLSGNIKKLDDVTVVPVYDAFPQKPPTPWDLIEITGVDVQKDDGQAGMAVFLVTLTVTVWSTYNGFKEISSQVAQIDAYLASKLAMASFTDVSIGGEFIDVRERKRNAEEGFTVRQAVYRRRWIISDNRM